MVHLGLGGTKVAFGNFLDDFTSDGCHVDLKDIPLGVVMDAYLMMVDHF